MYTITNSYIESINKKVRKSFISGTITTTTEKININDNNIQKGSLYITNQCVNKDNLEFGAIFSAECGFTLKCDIDRYSLYNAKIDLTEKVLLDDGTFENIPLGIFYVNEAKRNMSKINIVSYDSMMDLNIPIENDTTGNVYDLLVLISSKTGKELAQTFNEIGLLPNAKREYTVKKDRINTYRDLLSALGQVTCTFGLITRDDKIMLKSYSKSNNLSINNLQRKSSNISDYETYFNSVKASFISNENYYPYEVESYDTSVNGGLQLDLGEIPIVQGLPETKYAILNEILEEVIKYRYTPCNIQTINISALDLGDMITLTNVNNDENLSVISLITYYKWVYHGIETIKSAGGNPKLQNVKSKTDKQIQNAINSNKSNEIIVYSYENSKDYNIRNSEIEIIKFQFSSDSESNPIMLAMVQFELDNDGIVNFKFYEDKILREDLTVSNYYEKGKHFATLFMNAKDEAGTRTELTVNANVSYFESDNRVIKSKLDNINLLFKNVKNSIVYTAVDSQTNFALDSQYNENSIVDVYVNGINTDFTISNNNVVLNNIVADDIVKIDITNIEKTDYIPEIDTTVPLMTINKFDIHAIVYSQGLSATTNEWDGTIPVSENIPSIIIKAIGLAKINDNVNEVIK